MVLLMKRVLIVFDTKFGNTEKLGREIAAGIEETGTAECKVIGIKDVKCKFTGKTIDVTIEFLKMVGTYISGTDLDDEEALIMAEQIQQKYTKVIAQESDEKITETELYQELFNSYIRNLKKNLL